MPFDLYHAGRFFLRVALRCYFRRLDLFHPERVPLKGPVLFASNHPNSLADAFLLGVSVPRRVHFVATVQLFRFRFLRAFLLRLGLVPVNRPSDNPRAMRSVLATFEACYAVLEKGEAIGIFPEGITHDDPQLKPIKSGPARMALELEHRWGGKLGLQIVPVGLTFSAKEIFRSDALVHFGRPIQAAKFLEGYAQSRKECIQRLSEQIENQLQSLILHLNHLEHARVVQGVKGLYLDKLRLGNIVISEPLAPAAEELVLTQTIADAVEYCFEKFPERSQAFARKLEHYEGWLKRLRLSDEAIVQWHKQARLFCRNLGIAGLTVFGAPVALYGWLHSLLPLCIVRWSVRRHANPRQHKAQIATTSMVSGMASFGLCYSLFAVLFHSTAGWPWSVWYLLSLPAASFFAYFYFQDAHRLQNTLRNAIICLRGPLLAGRLIRMRQELINEIEALRLEYRAELESGRRIPGSGGRRTDSGGENPAS
jgi:glycerol-3-phosphate O-acyltransferase / dihydroxyacetone phosphate acyltransferase